MVDEVIKTAADALVELVKSRKRLSVDEAAKILKMDSSAVQNLVDFMVEEKILGVEYKFTTPYIYISEKKAAAGEESDARPAIRHYEIKEEFYKSARERKLPEEMIDTLWNKYLNKNMQVIKQDFYEQAEKKNLPYEQVNNLWEKYRSLLVEQNDGR